MLERGSSHRSLRIIKEATELLKSEFSDIPSRMRLLVDLTVIFTGNAILFLLWPGLSLAYISSDRVGGLLLRYVCLTTAAFCSFTALCDALFTIMVRIKSRTHAKYGLTYLVLSKHAASLSALAGCFFLAFALLLASEWRGRYVGMLRSESVGVLSLQTEMFVYLLSEGAVLFLSLGAAGVTMMICKCLILVLNYKMYSAHFAQRIESNRKNFGVIKLFKMVLGRRLTDCRADAHEIVDCISRASAGKDTSVELVGAVGDRTVSELPLPAGRACATTESFVQFFGEDNTGKIIEAVRPHQPDLITAEELELFCSSAFNEMDKLGDGLMENNVVIGKLNSVITVISSIVALLVFLTCLGKGEGVKHYGILFASAFIGAGYVFTPIIVDTFNSLIFILIIRPYDVGDVVIIDNQVLRVVDIGITTTTFIRDSLNYVMPNPALLQMSIYNLRLSDCKEEVMRFVFSREKFHARRAELEQRLEALTRASPTVHKQPCHLEQLKLIDRSSLEVGVRIYFRMNYQEIEHIQTRKDQFVLEIEKIVSDLELFQ
ncbi:hypothetical protein PAPHI01_0651 [Pancytospora philotis]|nr:hypothetical protein PAPHI01_0651 [Pancytospora philotis]